MRLFICASSVLLLFGGYGCYGLQPQPFTIRTRSLELKSTRPFSSPPVLIEQELEPALTATTTATSELLLSDLITTEYNSLSVAEEDLAGPHNNKEALVASPTGPGAATRVVAAKGTRAQEEQLHRWARRLNTKEDAFSMHKINCFANLLSSLAILACGVANGWTHIPDAMEPIQLMFQYTTIGIGVSAIRMAMKYRAKDPQVRDVMIGMVIASVSLATGGTWVSPFHQEWMSSSLGQGFFIALNAASFLQTTWVALQSDFVSQLSKDRMGKANYESMDWLRGLVEFGCGLVTAVPASMAVYTVWFYANFLPEQYVDWMDLHCTLGAHDGLALQTYLVDASGMGLLYSSFLTTLKDRKLIPSCVEGIGSALSIALVLFSAGVFASTQMLPYPHFG